MTLERERELETLEIDVTVGPQHPATHGVFRMVLAVDGEKVVDVVPHIGYLHRGAEKLSENLDYRQAIGLQDRTEYLAGFNGTAFTYGFQEREYIQDLFEEVSGDRLMYGYFRPGGVAWDVPDNFKERVHWVCQQTRVGISDIDGLLTKNEIFVARTRGIGALSVERAID